MKEAHYTPSRHGIYGLLVGPLAPILAALVQGITLGLCYFIGYFTIGQAS